MERVLPCHQVLRNWQALLASKEGELQFRQAMISAAPLLELFSEISELLFQIRNFLLQGCDVSFQPGE